MTTFVRDIGSSQRGNGRAPILSSRIIFSSEQRSHYGPGSLHDVCRKRLAVIQHMKTKTGVWFATHADIAKHAKENAA